MSIGRNVLKEKSFQLEKVNLQTAWGKTVKEALNKWGEENLKSGDGTYVRVQGKLYYILRRRVHCEVTEIKEQGEC